MTSKMPQRRLALYVLLAVGLVAVVAGVSIRLFRGPAPGEYRIGAILPMTGDAKSYGQWMKAGMQIGEQHANADLSGNGTVRVIFTDSESTAEGGERAFQRLVTVDHVDAVVTTVTPVTKALVPLAERHQIPLFTSAVAPGLVDGSRWSFRNSTNIKQEVSALFKAIPPLKIRTVALMYLDNGVGTWLSANFADLAKHAGIEVVTTVSYQKDDVDFHPQIATIKASQPDAVYLYGYTQLGLIAKQLRELGVNSQILGGLDMELPEVLAVGKNAVDGAIYTKSEYDPAQSGQLGRRFAQDYQRATGRIPDVYAAVHYDTVQILAAAFRSGGHDRSKVRNFIEELRGFDGASGMTTFGSSHDADKPVTVKTINRGQYQPFQR